MEAEADDFSSVLPQKGGTGTLCRSISCTPVRSFGAAELPLFSLVEMRLLLIRGDCALCFAMGRTVQWGAGAFAKMGVS